MAPLSLEDDNLGLRHKHYNEIVKSATQNNQPFENNKIDHDESDLENLLKIDVASNKKDVDFILEVFTCEDMLYVSRAIDKCSWLICDSQYAHIINPENLNANVFPKMLPMARNKLMLHIRLKLKSESRVEDFFLHETDIQKSLKWLPNCSLEFIEKHLAKHAEEIDEKMLKRLCEKSFSIIDVYIKNVKNIHYYLFRNVLYTAVYFLKRDTEKVLNLFESKTFSYDLIQFNKNNTKILMQKFPKRILDKFDIYGPYVHHETVAKFIKSQDIKEFLKKNSKNPVFTRSHLKNLHHYIKRIPDEDRFEYLKRVYIDKLDEAEEDSRFQNVPVAYQSACSYKKKTVKISSSNVYQWYKYTTFGVAYPELKKLIRNESNPEERNAIFNVLLTCAGHDLNHIKILLQYYHDRHINEPLKNKNQFVSEVLSRGNFLKFDVETWSIINQIFYSMEVYAESSKNNTQSCINAIVLYNIAQGKDIPDNIANKINILSLTQFKPKLSKQQSDLVVSYVLSKQEPKVLIEIQNETDFSNVLANLNETLIFLKDWEYDIKTYPWLLNKIKSIDSLRKKHSWNHKLNNIYNVNKSWRRILFDLSISLDPNEKTILNVLKHDTNVFKEHEEEIKGICNNEDVPLVRFLRKLRIYWPDTLAKEWRTMLSSNLTKCDNKSSVENLIILLPRNELLNIIKQNVPQNEKINWSEEDEASLNLRKYICKYMHLGRPQPSTDMALLYAKGNYLQFVLPSLISLYTGLKPIYSYENIKKLLDAPVSLQKHGIRFAFSKLGSEHIHTIVMSIWNSSKNASIRAVLFEHTYKLMCKEKNETNQNELWNILKTFISKLSKEENKNIYSIMGEVNKVPTSIKGDFFITCYKFLKTLPPSANCDSVISNLMRSLPEFIELIDRKFMTKFLLEIVETKMITKRYDYSENYIDLIPAYLLSSKDIDTVISKDEDFLKPMLEKCAASWGGKYFVKQNFNDVLESITKALESCILKKHFMLPLKHFSTIKSFLETKLVLHEDYFMIRFWQVTDIFMNIISDYRESVQEGKDDEKENFVLIYSKVFPEWIKKCLDILKKDVDTLVPNIYTYFSKALFKFLHNIFSWEMFYEKCVDINFINALLEYSNDDIYNYMLAIDVLSNINEDVKKETEIVHIHKKIKCHPSKEVQFHYFYNLNVKYPMSVYQDKI